MKQAIQNYVSGPHDSSRFCIGADSLVVIGAWGKGRSSSIQLNGVLRSCIGWSVLGCCRAFLFYVPTKLNPADDPSRSVALRPARAPRGPLAHWTLPERTLSSRGMFGPFGDARLCIEIFSGLGRLALALIAAGFGATDPFEYSLGGDRFEGYFDLRGGAARERLERWVRSGNIHYINFAIPCSTWTLLKRWAKEGTRPSSKPQGNGDNIKEVEANDIALFV